MAVLLPIGISDHQSAKNQLRVVRWNDQSFVQSLYLNALGHELRFLVPERPREEADLMVLSIPVHSEGR